MGYVPGDNHLAPDVTLVQVKVDQLMETIADRAQFFEVMREGMRYSGWWANRARILANRAARKANKRARKAEDRAADRDRRLVAAQQRQRVPLIAELNGGEYDAFTEEICATLQANNPKMVSEIDSHGWREMVGVVIKCHRKQ
eukprot:6473409-Prymnesium_polylepis.1